MKRAAEACSCLITPGSCTALEGRTGPLRPGKCWSSHRTRLVGLEGSGG